MRILNAELADTMGNLLSRACAKSVNKRQVFPGLDRSEMEKLLQMDVVKKLVDLIGVLPGMFIYLLLFSIGVYYVVIECIYISLTN